ncbi:6-phosphogluconolactonase [Chelativorans sp. YIM 93263]|uniref:6-phosphogluconolactonase n=1 Tax=Chelativorans sp. YIM 93263 TaxID=2906648 RepID=UPI002377FBB6|nr:6-phosphogluconolactonase [Chelativorans sp. YIM 93263]
MTEPIWEEFGDRQKLAETLADVVAEELSGALKARGRALLAVSGGTTPPPFFRALSEKRIDWRHVTVTLVDERFVPTTSERSNARLVTQHLLQNQAARAQFFGLYNEAASVEEAAEVTESKLAILPMPLDVVVLGMGTDQHTASFFPDADNIDDILSDTGERRVLPVHAQSVGEPRLTLSMPVITQARFLALHIEGAEKKTALEAALSTDDRPLPPVRAVMERADNPAHIYWAPKQDTSS